MLCLESPPCAAVRKMPPGIKSSTGFILCPSLFSGFTLLCYFQNHLVYDGGQKRKFAFLNIVTCQALMVLKSLHKLCIWGSICLMPIVNLIAIVFSVKSETRKITGLKYCYILASGLHALGRSTLFLALKDPA